MNSEFSTLLLEAPLPWWPLSSTTHAHYTAPLESALASITSRSRQEHVAKGGSSSSGGSLMDCSVLMNSFSCDVPPHSGPGASLHTVRLQCEPNRLGNTMLLTSAVGVKRKTRPEKCRKVKDSKKTKKNETNDDDALEWYLDVDCSAFSGLNQPIRFRILGSNPTLPPTSAELGRSSEASHQKVVTPDTRISILGSCPAGDIPLAVPTETSILSTMEQSFFLQDSHNGTSAASTTSSNCKRIVKTILSTLHSPFTSTAAAYTSLLVSGSPGNGKTTFAKSLLNALPKHLVVSSDMEEDAAVLIDRRYVSCVGLVDQAQSAGSAAIAVQKLFRTSFVTSALSGDQTTEEDVVPPYHKALVLVLDDVQLLCPTNTSNNNFVDGAAHQLCHEIDRIMMPFSGTNCKGGGHKNEYSAVVVMACCEDVSQLHSSLGEGSQRLVQNSLKMPMLGKGASVRRSALEWCLRQQAQVLAQQTGRTTGKGVQMDLLTRLEEADQVSFADVVRIAKCCAVDEKDEALTVLQRGNTINSVVNTQPQRPRGLQALVGVEKEISALRKFLINPLKLRSTLTALGVALPKGALIVGPSGSGKTAILSALAEEIALLKERIVVPAESTEAKRPSATIDPLTKLTIKTVDAHTLVTKEVGESEKNIANMFNDARANSPCALLLDNLDAICPPRNRVMHESNSAADRTLSTFLAEMDGVKSSSGAIVVVIAAAPRFEDLDAAAIRPGRLDVHLELQLPTNQASGSFVGSLLRPVAETCSLPANVVHGSATKTMDTADEILEHFQQHWVALVEAQAEEQAQSKSIPAPKIGGRSGFSRTKNAGKATANGSNQAAVRWSYADVQDAARYAILSLHEQGLLLQQRSGDEETGSALEMKHVESALKEAVASRVVFSS